MYQVFSRVRPEGREIKSGTYNLLIGLILLWGFGVNWLMVKYAPLSALEYANSLLFLIGYFISCLIGIHLFTKSSNPFVSFIGYNFVVIPFGFIINVAVHRSYPDLVLSAVRITGMVTAGMMILGSIFPKFFKKIAGALGIALLLVVLIETIEIWILKIHHSSLDWIVVLLFSGYIGYDWGRANEIPKTIDNAVDSAAALYIDIINLFLRILQILTRKK